MLLRLLWLARLAVVGTALVLAVLIALIVPSTDNGPYMTPFTLAVVALITALVLLGFIGGLRQTEAEAPDHLRLPPSDPDDSDLPAGC